jgi:uncharacterized linocin/CFP29 family protein
LNMDILKRSLAPISDAAWEAIENQARLRLQGNLSARKLVKLNGPHGWNFGAVNTGRLQLNESSPIEDLCWGLRKVLPLVEVRLPFKLSIMELDSVDRGARDPDLDSLEKAAFKAASFEEACIYFGFDSGGIKGMRDASPYEPIALAEDPEDYQELFAQGVGVIQGSGIGGPYSLVLGRTPYTNIKTGDRKGYPLIKRLEAVLGGSILWSPAFEDGAMLLSTREGHFELTLGQDFSIGYVAHDRDSIELYLAESFAFQVHEPRAVVEYRA